VYYRVTRIRTLTARTRLVVSCYHLDVIKSIFVLYSFYFIILLFCPRYHDDATFGRDIEVILCANDTRLSIRLAAINIDVADIKIMDDKNEQ